MNIGSASSMQSLFQTSYTGGMGGGRPPSPEQLISKMEEGLESGSIDSETLQTRLSDRFGEAADGLVLEDGTLDSEKLASLMEDALASRSGQRPSGPPEGVGKPADVTNMLQDYLDEQEDSEKTLSLVEQLYGRAGQGNASNQELFSILA